MAATTSFVRCPGLVCRDQEACTAEVEARYTARQVTVAPCASLLEQGWRGAQLVLSHSEALARLVPAQPAAVQHVARVAVSRPARYPFVPVCSCGWADWGFVVEHAAQILVDAHLEGAQASAVDPVSCS